MVYTFDTLPFEVALQKGADVSGFGDIFAGYENSVFEKEVREDDSIVYKKGEKLISAGIVLEALNAGTMFEVGGMAAGQTTSAPTEESVEEEVEVPAEDADAPIDTDSTTEEVEEIEESSTEDDADDVEVTEDDSDDEVTEEDKENLEHDEQDVQNEDSSTSDDAEDSE